MTVSRNDIEAAARGLWGRVRRTPLLHARGLSAATGRQVWLKVETLQHTRSFKYRGALNAVLAMAEPRAEMPRLVTASAGNHGLALAAAATTVGVELLIFVPACAPASKLERMRGPGITLDTSSADYDQAEMRALSASACGLGRYISPYNHRDVVAGAGTVGLEILAEMPSPGAIIVPTGGGGLLSGIAVAAGQATRVVGVEAAVNPAFTAALDAGEIVAIDPGTSVADGLLGNLEPASITFDLVRAHASGVRTVEEASTRRAIGALLAAERLVAEGAGAIGVGGLLAGSFDDLPDPLVIVLSGANIDTCRFLEVVGE